MLEENAQLSLQKVCRKKQEDGNSNVLTSTAERQAQREETRFSLNCRSWLANTSNTVSSVSLQLTIARVLAYSSLYKLWPHHPHSLDFTKVSGCLVVVQVATDQLQQWLIPSGTGYLPPLVRLPFFHTQQELRAFAPFPILRLMTLSLARDSSCWAYLPSNSY